MTLADFQILLQIERNISKESTIFRKTIPCLSQACPAVPVHLSKSIGAAFSWYGGQLDTDSEHVLTTGYYIMFFPPGWGICDLRLWYRDSRGKRENVSIIKKSIIIDYVNHKRAKTD